MTRQEAETVEAQHENHSYVRMQYWKKVNKKQERSKLAENKKKRVRKMKMDEIRSCEWKLWKGQGWKEKLEAK